jgi:hypothetical protein
MCMEISEIKAQEEVLKSKVELFKMEMSKVKSISKKARYYAMLKNVKDLIEKEMENYKVQLINENVEEFFKDEDLKVVLREGNSKSYINKNGLYIDFVEKRRINDFLQSCTVTETALKELPDGEELIKKHKVETGEKNKPSVLVSTLSKEDRKKLLEEV